MCVCAPLMAQPYHNSTSSFQEDHQHYHLFNFDQISSSLSFSCPVFVNDHLYSRQLQGQTYFTEAPQHFQLALQLEADHQMVPCGGSCDLLGATTAHDHEKQSNQYADSSLKLKIWKSSDHEVLIETNDGTDDHHENTINSSTKWISSKGNPSDQITNSDMAVVNYTTTHKFEDTKKYPTSPLAATDQINNSSSPSSSNTPIRVCADCHTTKTPLWRSGPRGPKTLCNACGIRQRKARRAMAAAASGTIIKVDKSSKEGRSSTVQKKEKKPIRNKNNNRSCLPFKKRCKLNSPSTRGRKKKQVGSNFEELAIRVNQNINSTYQLSVFPQDEKEAAILLMALSYGLVNG